MTYRLGLCLLDNWACMWSGSRLSMHGFHSSCSLCTRFFLSSQAAKPRLLFSVLCSSGFICEATQVQCAFEVSPNPRHVTAICSAIWKMTNAIWHQSVGQNYYKIYIDFFTILWDVLLSHLKLLLLNFCTCCIFSSVVSVPNKLDNLNFCLKVETTETLCRVIVTDIKDSTYFTKLSASSSSTIQNRTCWIF